MKQSIIFHIVCPLLLGSSMYLLFRETDLFHLIGIDTPLISVINIPEWIVYNLPDGIWYYAFLVSINLIWDYNKTKGYNFWITLAIISGPFTEFLQWISFIPGTYDILDLVIYFSFLLLYYLNFPNNKYSFYLKT